jgi:hypothetical protein
MVRRGLALIVLLGWLLPASALASWSLEVGTGSSYSFFSPLVIHQTGFPDIRLDGRFDTKAFTEVPYYDVRLARGGWELELVHHKLYLQNPPPEVQSFQITHGFNFITANHCWSLFGFDLRAGAGMVLAHPQTTIRNRVFNEHSGILGLGFFVSGVSAQAGLGWRYRLTPRLDAGTEVKLTSAAARVPIADGNVDIANFAVHGLVSLRYRF